MGDFNACAVSEMMPSDSCAFTSIIFTFYGYFDFPLVDSWRYNFNVIVSMSSLTFDSCFRVLASILVASLVALVDAVPLPIDP